MSEKNKVFQTLEYEGSKYSFQYPKGGKIIEISRPDGTGLLRITGLVNNKKVNIDIEVLPNIKSAREEIERLEKVDRIKFENDYVPPHELTVGNLIGWRLIYRFIDGGVDLGYVDTILVDSTFGVIRFMTLADKEIYNSVRVILDLVINSFHIHNNA